MIAGVKTKRLTLNYSVLLQHHFFALPTPFPFFLNEMFITKEVPQYQILNQNTAYDYAYQSPAIEQQQYDYKYNFRLKLNYKSNNFSNLPVSKLPKITNNNRLFCNNIAQFGYKKRETTCSHWPPCSSKHFLLEHRQERKTFCRGGVTSSQVNFTPVCSLDLERLITFQEYCYNR